MSVPQGIRVWMAVKDCKPNDIAKKYGRSLVFVGYFLNGKRTSKKLVDFMVQEGCPEEYFKNGRVLEDKDGRI